MTIDATLFAQELFAAAEKNGLSGRITEAQGKTLHALTEHMLTVNEQFNLTAIREWRRVILLHYIDCLVAADLYPVGARVIDVGCGAGFPSLPLAIFRPDLTVTALDATAKRVQYVKETASFLKLENLFTLVGRAEDIAKDPAHRETYDVATARAVAALPVLCELCLPFVRVGGAFVALKGKSGAEELSAAKHALSSLGGAKERILDTPLYASDEEIFSHTSVIILKEKNTPALYPRAYGKILKAPL